MALHFYDGQIRRYITQMIRMLSNFSYKDNQGNEREIPITYGDLTRQVASIIKDNSENKVPCAPRMAVYITNLEMDRNRTRDATHVSKVHIRERAYDEQNQEYLNHQGKNYTVERLMPTPFTLTVNADIWTTNTDQKLQILEQILMYFNPSLEIQTTDNYIDWTSLSVVNLENITFSSRSIPQGIDSEIDVATLTFSTPIWISPPAKVKRLGVITNIITSIFDERTGTIDLGESMPELTAWSESAQAGAEDVDGNRKATTSDTNIMANVNYLGYEILVQEDTVKLIENGRISTESWRTILDPHPGTYTPGLSMIYLTRKLDNYITIAGSFEIDSNNESQLNVSWDTDTFPNDTAINGPARNPNGLTSIDYIIDPLRINPEDLKVAGLRILLLEDIGDKDNTNGANAWKNNDGSDFVAGENDIVEWSGSKWVVVFDASKNTDNIVYTTNLNTNTQYRWDGAEWLLSIDGIYPVGTWRLNLDG